MVSGHTAAESFDVSPAWLLSKVPLEMGVEKTFLRLNNVRILFYSNKLRIITCPGLEESSRAHPVQCSCSEQGHRIPGWKAPEGSSSLTFQGNNTVEMAQHSGHLGLGAPTSSLGSLFHCLMVRMVETFLLPSSGNLASSSLSPWLLVFSMGLCTNSISLFMMTTLVYLSVVRRAHLRLLQAEQMQLSALLHRPGLPVL